MPRVRVLVTLKPTLLDAQGRTVQEALHALGYHNVHQVRIGKVIEMDIADEGQPVEAQVKEMCDRLLANPVTELYEIEVLG
ncbi:MAG: phosphoribosylformylglycinamidine synthase subunit PurS [Armatimonadota bacterium]|nr:phosphoribosylformylglycinamidine synthase subunit PurS [bacterium]MDW8289661.1 phosphoribosylformylglycinamidine synthase subunit PurS [Armatimonadota bacterium]